MTDHRHALRSFLETDLHRLEASLEGCPWTASVAERLTAHLRFAAQVEAVYLEGQDPRNPALRATVESIAPDSALEAIEQLTARTQSLIRAMERAPDRLLRAPVLDPHERGLTVLGHLYDFCRASASLVGWLQATAEQATANPAEPSLDDWFDPSEG